MDFSREAVSERERTNQSKRSCGKFPKSLMRRRITEAAFPAGIEPTFKV